MSYIPDQTQNSGLFVKSTVILSPTIFYTADVNSLQFKELLATLVQNINDMNVTLNAKVSGYYLNDEFLTGKLFPPANGGVNQLDLIPGYGKLIVFGPVALGVNPPHAHGLAITNTWQFIVINGAAFDSGTLIGYPVTFAGAANNNIEVSIDGTNLYINNNSGQTFTSCNIVLEYIKNS
jgi:hypothetical protein